MPSRTSLLHFLSGSVQRQGLQCALLRSSQAVSMQPLLPAMPQGSCSRLLSRFLSIAAEIDSVNSPHRVDTVQGYEGDPDSAESGHADQQQTQWQQPEGARTVHDYNNLLTTLAQRRSTYKMRDVFEEMVLDGVAPNADSYFKALFASMQARRLGDALFYWREMKRHGCPPAPNMYSIIISAAGRAAQVEVAVEEMRDNGIAPTKNSYLAMLNALAEAGRIEEAGQLFQQMEAAGVEPDEFAYTALINAHRHAQQVPSDSAARIKNLMEASRAAPALPFSRRMHMGISLVVYNAALNAFMTLGQQEQVLVLFGRMAEEGLDPDYDSYSAVIRSCLHTALAGDTATPPASLASAADEGHSEDSDDAEADEDQQRLAEAQHSHAALPSQDAELPADYATLPRWISHRLMQLRARMDLVSWDRAVQFYRDAMAKGMALSPSVHFEVMQTGLELAGARVDNAFDVVEESLNCMADLKLFMNTQHGSMLLAMVSRRELHSAKGLAVANKIWDRIYSHKRVPRSASCRAYLAMLHTQDPHNHRIAQVQTMLKMDPRKLRTIE